ncbi:MAG: class II aldolase [Gammaproteobacteria bacterium]|nr:class II aldolase [Gammaproteobacteria bacterium]
MNKELIALCHRYGTTRFVSGGGGNISWKNKDTLWIKASGTYLSKADETTLVAVNREPLGELYRTPAPPDSSEREAWAKQIIQSAVEDNASSGRPSVETPLHDLFEAAYVVHTHAPLVNGLTCAINAESACRELFPDALWIPYVDPGVTLCLQAKQQFEDYVRDHGAEPSVIIMQNHGLVVAADDLNEIDLIYERIFEVLEDIYRSAGLDTKHPDFVVEPTDTLPACELVSNIDPGILALECPGIHPSPGPLTPDHIVYSGVEPLNSVNGNGFAGYRERFGSDPQLLIHKGTTYALGATGSQAKTASALAADGAHVLRLTEAFGGANFMSEEQWRFVVNWEAEAYRQTVAESY